MRIAALALVAALGGCVLDPGERFALTTDLPDAGDGAPPCRRDGDCPWRGIQVCCDGHCQAIKANCGACGVTCSDNFINGPACVNGACDGMCSYGHADCNGDKRSDGCEVDLNSDPSNCGVCGHGCGGAPCTCGVCGAPCSDNHIAVPVCNAMGACSGNCDQGWADCNGDKRSDGCETNVEGDAVNCGACGHDCNGRPCVNYTCQ